MIDISQHKAKKYSQRGEDGMIECVLRELGIQQGWCCEFGAWDGQHLSNVRKLIEEDWNALMIEGDKNKYKELKQNLSNYPRARTHNSFVALDGHRNLNSILSQYDVPLDLDVLSIDIDSCDYWVWLNLRYTPKLVIIEYNPNWEEAITVPYLDPFPEWQGSQYYGASAKALEILGTHKGYDLIGYSPCNNLFFLRKDLNRGRFKIFDLGPKDHILTPHHGPITREEEVTLVRNPPVTVSSYQQNNYGTIFDFIVNTYSPKKIVEFGILDGYSLDRIIDAAPLHCSIEAYDIFEDCSFRHADRQEMERRYPGVAKYGDYYTMYGQFSNDSIDLMHIDVGNDGDTYECFFQYYADKLSPNGIALLEGGGAERDSYFWMKEFGKPRIRPVLEKYHHLYNIFVLNPFPSVTMVSRRAR